MPATRPKGDETYLKALAREFDEHAKSLTAEINTHRATIKSATAEIKRLTAQRDGIRNIAKELRS